MKKLVVFSSLMIVLLASAGCSKGGNSSPWQGIAVKQLDGSPSYQKGYNEGYAKGYEKAADDFLSDREYDLELSFNPAFDKDYKTGYETGYEVGYKDGYTEAEGIGKESEEGLPPGTSKADDYDAGYKNGYQVGSMDGVDDWVEGWGYYEPNPTQDYINKFCYGRSDSYIEGWVTGYKDGYLKAWNGQEQPGNQQRSCLRSSVRFF
jgi:hypothetical protein